MRLKPITELAAGEFVLVRGRYERVKRVTPRTDGFVVVATKERIAAAPDWAHVGWMPASDVEDALDGIA